MSHTWILDVLTDLRTYARKNDLNALVVQIDETQRVAAAELAWPLGEPTVLPEDGGAGRGDDGARLGGLV